jgi:hypothetical protein
MNAITATPPTIPSQCCNVIVHLWVDLSWSLITFRKLS